MAGLLPPWVAVKETLAGLEPIAGGTGAAATVKATGMLTVVAPAALSVMLSLYLPAGKVPVATVAVTVPVPAPAAGLRDSHVACSLAFQFKAPPPVLLIVRVWAAGFAPPCWAVKDRLVGLIPIAGGTGAAVTVNITGTVTGVAPGALRVIIPL